MLSNHENNKLHQNALLAEAVCQVLIVYRGGRSDRITIQSHHSWTYTVRDIHIKLSILEKLL